jgi:hypothetical protein
MTNTYGWSYPMRRPQNRCGSGVKPSVPPRANKGSGLIGSHEGTFRREIYIRDPVRIFSPKSRRPARPSVKIIDRRRLAGARLCSLARHDTVLEVLAKHEKGGVCCEQSTTGVHTGKAHSARREPGWR